MKTRKRPNGTRMQKKTMKILVLELKENQSASKAQKKKSS
jgi:hypothetical protein